MYKKLSTYLLLLLLLIAVISAGFAVYKRLGIEARNSSVEFSMDWQDIKELSLKEGIPADSLLKKLKEAGLNSIALTEDTLESLELDGRIAWLTGYEQSTLLKISKAPKTGSKLSTLAKKISNPLMKSKLRISKPNPDYSYVITDDKNLLQRLKTELTVTLGEKQVREIAGKKSGPFMLEIIDDEEDLMNLGVGFSADRIKNIILRGFIVVPRLKNNYRLNASNVGEKLSILKSYGPFNTIIFDGEEVLGYKNNISEIALTMKNQGINYGYIEMAEQKGDSELLKSIKTNVIRVHSITEDEMLKKMTESEALSRFERAVEERGVRLLFIRPFYIPDKGKNLIETNVSYISDLKSRINKLGFNIGPADRPGIFHVTIKTAAILSLGIGAGLVFLIASFIDIGILTAAILLAIFFLMPFAFRSIHHLLLFQQMGALLSAIIFPTLAITLVFRKKTNGAVPAMPLSRAILYVLGSYAISMVGAIFIIGLLADTQFMLGSRQFIGIKAAFVLPIVLIAVYGALIDESRARDMKDKLLKWLNSPITIINVLVFVVLVGTGALYILRSGNFGIGVFDAEKVARGLLENVMIVRPRTKEFLIGYPVLFLGMIYYLKGRRAWLWPFLLIGIIGPISTLNTFCHIHSPLMISFLRSIYGVILGIFIGTIIYGIYSLISSSPLRPSPFHGEGKSDNEK